MQRGLAVQPRCLSPSKHMMCCKMLVTRKQVKCCAGVVLFATCGASLNPHQEIRITWKPGDGRWIRSSVALKRAQCTTGSPSVDSIYRLEVCIFTIAKRRQECSKRSAKVLHESWYVRLSGYCC